MRLERRLRSSLRELRRRQERMKAAGTIVSDVFQGGG